MASDGKTKANLLILAFAPIFLAQGFLQVMISAWLPTVGIPPLQVGLLVTIQGGLAVASSIPIGVASDIYGRRFILIAGGLASSVGVVIFALTISFPCLALASTILGLAEGATVSVWNALLADLSDSTARDRVFSNSYVMLGVASGVGLLLPGLFPYIGPLAGLSDYSLHGAALLGLGLASFLSPLGVTVLLRDHREAPRPPVGFSGLKSAGRLVRLGVVGGSIGLGAGFIVPLVGTWFLLRFGVGDSYSGPVLAASYILVGAGAFAAPWLAKGVGQVDAVILTAGLSMIFMLGMAFVPELNLAAAFYIIRSGLANMDGPLLDSFSMSIFPPQQRGLVSAATNTIFRLPSSVSTSVGGLLLGAGLLTYPFVIAGILYGIGLATFYGFFRSERGMSEPVA